MLEQQGRGGDLLDNFVKGYILDGMAKNMDPPAPKNASPAFATRANVSSL